MQERAAIAMPHGIDERFYEKIGGIDQWLTIRGWDRANPVILLLHGGPGNPASAHPQWLFGWEKDFTIVQWDQRGSGMTYEKYGAATPGLNQARLVQDGLELAEFIRTKLDRRKVILLGHSWGTTIGLQMVGARPDLFSAFVGTGQISSSQMVRNAVWYPILLNQAKHDGDTKTVAKLTDFGPPPYDRKRFQEFDAFLASFSKSDHNFRISSALIGLSDPYASLWQDYVDYIGGLRFTTRAMLPDLMAFDRGKLPKSLAVPIFVFQGDHDAASQPQLLDEFMDKLEAPLKILVRINGAGHMAFVTHADQFHALLNSYVRQIAVKE
jgi:pimeloyl-ACP methyl ester carboxylesterase